MNEVIVLLIFILACILISIIVTRIIVKKQLEKSAISMMQTKINKILKETGRTKNLFHLDNNRSALVVIDMQNAFCSKQGDRYLSPTQQIIPNINSLVDTCRTKDIPIIWVRHNITLKKNKHDAGLWLKIHPDMAPSTLANLNPQTEIYSGMHLDKNDHQVTKNRYSAFINNSSNLSKILSSLKRDQLIVTGIATNACVESTVRDGMQLDYELFVVSDATASFDHLFHKASLMAMKLLFAEVITTGEITHLLSINK